MNSFKVPIKNALFMYSYIWDKVDKIDLTELSSDDDFSSSNILSELFLLNIQDILKRGLYREYINKNDELGIIRGKVDFNKTIVNQSQQRGKLYCNYDELEEDNIFNQIIKYVAIKLYRSSDINDINKKKLNRIILYLNKVQFVEIKKADFNNLNFNKSNYYYFLIIKICELIISLKMLSEENGKYKFLDLFDSDDNMETVFELFVYKFYEHELSKKKEYSVFYQSHLKWNFKGGNQELLPIMKMDTKISSDKETIVIDTKYKEHYTSVHYDKESLVSDNIYQMMAYLNNINVDNELRGILLYPLPFNSKPIKESYDTKIVSENGISDAKIQFITIDLSQDWKKIVIELLKIIDLDLAIVKANELGESL